eukprot:gene23214-30432_t
MLAKKRHIRMRNPSDQQSFKFKRGPQDLPKLVMRIITPAALMHLDPCMMEHMSQRLVAVRTCEGGKERANFHPSLAISLARSLRRSKTEQQQAPSSPAVSTSPAAVMQAVHESVAWAVKESKLDHPSSTTMKEKGQHPYFHFSLGPDKLDHQAPWLFLEIVSVNPAAQIALRMGRGAERDAQALRHLSEVDPEVARALQEESRLFMQGSISEQPRCTNFSFVRSSEKKSALIRGPYQSFAVNQRYILDAPTAHMQPALELELRELSLEDPPICNQRPCLASVSQDVSMNNPSQGRWSAAPVPHNVPINLASFLEATQSKVSPSLPNPATKSNLSLPSVVTADVRFFHGVF